MRTRKSYRKLPVWVARVTETVHVNGRTYINVVTKTGKPRTLRVKSKSRTPWVKS